MCGPCAEPGESCTPEPERFIGYAKCSCCGGDRKVTQQFGYVFTGKCEKCGGQ